MQQLQHRRTQEGVGRSTRPAHASIFPSLPANRPRMDRPGETCPEHHPQITGALSAHSCKSWPNPGLTGGAAWRVLDARFHGVAQRRRRVFAVIDTRDRRRAAPAPFERESPCRDHPTSKAKRQALTGSVAGGVAGADTGMGAGNRPNHPDGQPGRRHPADGPYPTSAGGTGTTGGRNIGAPTDVVQPVRTSNTNPNGGHSPQSDAMDTSDTTVSTAVPCNAGDPANAEAGYEVRRLTPRECERLQGLPDDYTNVASNGKPAPDAKRHRAPGNSMAVPVMRWIGEGINPVEQAKQEGTP